MSYKVFDLKRISYIVFGVYILIQLILVILLWDVEQSSDQGRYIKIATYCFEHGEWYPNSENINDTYIWAPGLINFFILQLKVLGTLKFNFLFNLIFNINIIYCIRYIANRFFTENTAYISIILYCLIYSNLFVILPAGTEVPFLCLSLSAFCFTLKENKYCILFAGVLYALANWIRPLIVIFLLVSIFYMIINKYSIKNYILLFFSLFIVTGTIGFVNFQRTGYFITQSTTSGINLIMTANDKAYGGVATSLMNDSTTTVYLKNASEYTFAQKDSIWKKRAIDWILDNPIKYAKLYCLKLGGLFIEDSWSDRPILGGSGFIDKSVQNGMNNKAFFSRILLMGLKSLVYYVVCVFFIYSLAIYRKEIFKEKGYILLILLFGTLSTCLFAVTPRYHYPFLFVIVIWAAYAINHLIVSKK